MESTDRILDAAIARFAMGGMRAVSIREVARIADVDPSAIQYRFGTKANLWKAALERAIACDLERIHAFGAMLASLNAGQALTADEGIVLLRHYIGESIDAWRDVTITWHSLLIEGLRQRSPSPIMIGWAVDRTAAWASIARQMGFRSEPAGRTLLLALSTIEIFLFGILGTVERKLYCEDFIRFVFLRLRGSQLPPETGDWFSNWCAKRTDARFEPGQPGEDGNGPVQALSDAVARLLLVHGAEGVTHRAIASEASLSLAATTRHFTSLQDLLRAGYDRIGVNMLRHLEAPERMPRFAAPQDMAGAVASAWLSDDAMQGRALTGLLDVHIAAARDETLLPAAAAIIAKLTVLATRYFTDDNTLGVRTPFEAHVHYALSQVSILFAALQGTKPASLAQRASEDIDRFSRQLFSPAEEKEIQ